MCYKIMSMSRLTKKKHSINQQKSKKKKHVETMFLTNKAKNFPYYFKSAAKNSKIENNINLLNIKRGYFYVKSTKAGFIEIDSLKAVMRLYKWYLKKYNLETSLLLQLFVFPDFVLTSKPKDMRMGKGKGAPSKKVALAKIGKILLKLELVNLKPRLLFIVKNLIKNISYKLPVQTCVSFNFW